MAEPPDRTVFFPDTNLFIQCGPLESLDWRLVSDAPMIELLVTRPVQAEIDRQKGKGSGRLGNRARATSSLFRRALDSADERLQVRSAAPEVFLQLRQELRPSSEHAEALDYSERDDQLVGIAAAYACVHPLASVSLLTYDTGPMLSAKNVGLRYVPIPDAWLLTPETDERDKQITGLRSEIERYQRTEPTIELHATGTALDHSFTINYYTALSEEQVQELITVVRQAHPPVENFGSREAEERPGAGTGILAALNREIFEPASQEAIDLYRVEHYPGWLSRCESALGDLHVALNRQISWPAICITLANVGGRPAEDVHLAFKTNGRMQLFIPRDEEEEPQTEVSLPHPPTAPEGKWSRKPTTTDLIRGRARLTPFDFRPITRPHFPSIELPQPRDANAFYYKPHRPSHPVPSVTYECAQWRHQQPPESFSFEIRPDLVEQKFSGALTIELHAANTTKPFTRQFPIRLVVQQLASLDIAKSLIDGLLQD